LRNVEAPPGFEPGVEVLQTSALPLGDGAGETVWSTRRAVRLRACGATRDNPRLARQPQLTLRLTRVSEGWSGKRDSDPRLRTWQGRTLPLSYSRSNLQQSHHSRTERKTLAASSGGVGLM